ncbi:Rieske 2Fe-2S domain-containing protein [Aquihabitans sp. G128]|uniref:QcrA and Rieske domain-containing protein n=1 Tax=Aquihabitans sp. G128 TaxID=2849779 RepID=UPI001C245442|nr:Rieske 2Fe-2S domain-containing protein [Aquihabitans sp. G128]QXC63374.1 Rieske 2Fe-2S domain-containing protein [Aquihabitans sp. G128]
MSPDLTFTLLAVGLLAAAALVITSSRRAHSGDATGDLARDARARDRRRWSRPRHAPSRSRGAEVEHAAVLARRAGELEPVDGSPAPVEWRPPDPEEVGTTRRQFLNRSIIGGFALSLSGFGAALLAYLWPTTTAGFGSKIAIGSINDVNSAIKAGTGFAYYPDGRMWVVPYPDDALPKAKAAYSPAELVGMEAGFVALYQKCVHLGCRVPACLTSQWFECPCHGSQYDHVGEKKAGPAPRGLDRFPISVSGGALTVNTGQVILGPPVGTNTTGQEAEGPPLHLRHPRRLTTPRPPRPNRPVPPPTRTCGPGPPCSAV